MGPRPLMASLSRPFVLLDDARPGGRALAPVRSRREIVETRDSGEVRACLERLRGRQAAGFLAYEAGLALEDKLAPLRVRARRGRAAFALVRPVRAGARRSTPTALLPDPRRRLGRRGRGR